MTRPRQGTIAALAGLAAALWLSACRPGSMPAGECAGPKRASVRNVFAVLVGSDARLTFSHPLGNCFLPGSVVVRAAVSSPDGEVPASVPRLNVDDDGVATFDVTFSLVHPGVHHLSLQFEPDLGVQEHEVIGVLDRRQSSGTAVELPTSASCMDVITLPSNAVLCATAGDVRVYRAGALVQTILRVSAYAVQDSVVWMEIWWSDGHALRRFEDRGSGPLTLTVDAPRVTGAALKMLPGGDVLEVSSTTATRWSFDAGALVEPFPSVTGRFDGPVALFPSGARLLAVSDAGVCVFTVPGAGPREARCNALGFEGRPLSADHGGVWLSSFLPHRLHYVRAADDSAVDGGHASSLWLELPFGTGANPGPTTGRAQATVPFLEGNPGTPSGVDEAGAPLLPRAVGSSILLESYGSACGDDQRVLVGGSTRPRIVPRSP